MNVLLLRLYGPMQSWGVQSKFSIRDTGMEPSKSGVVGMLCAALGRPRRAAVNDLAALRMGVRVDRPGILRYDYQTASDVLRAGGGIKPTEPSRRYYLADAAFLIGFESDELALLHQLDQALAHPVWPLCLGRKSFVPSISVRVSGGLQVDTSLQGALTAYPRLVPPRKGDGELLRLVIEDSMGDAARLDQPVSFALRQFALRRVATTFCTGPEALCEDI
ncbi:MAG: type I-E CRISPR-associated protein Cas5/CasD [Caldilineaceae bacterium]